MRWLTGLQIGRPDLLILETTNHCNLQCPICGAGNEPHSMIKGYLPREQFEALVATAYELQPRTVCLHARGEPLLHPHLAELVGMLHKKGLHTHLATNGLLLTPSIAQELQAAGLDQLVVSHPGLSAENYRACRGTDLLPTYEAALMDALKTWEGSGQEVRIRCLMLSNLLVDGPAAITRFLTRWLVHPAVSRIEFTGYQPWPHHVYEELLQGLHTKPRICTQTFDQLTMLWDGTLTPCTNDTRGELALGTWPDMSLVSAFNCRRVRQIRQAHMHPPPRDLVCRHCLMPRSSSPVVFASKKDIVHRSNEKLDAWMNTKARKMWQIFKA